jgi:hypothetical protein
MLLPTSKFLREMFTSINEDCQKNGESVVPFSDEEYYSDQIFNIYDEEIDYETCQKLSRELNLGGFDN